MKGLTTIYYCIKSVSSEKPDSNVASSTYGTTRRSWLSSKRQLIKFIFAKSRLQRNLKRQQKESTRKAKLLNILFILNNTAREFIAVIFGWHTNPSIQAVTVRIDYSNTTLLINGRVNNSLVMSLFSLFQFLAPKQSFLLSLVIVNISNFLPCFYNFWPFLIVLRTHLLLEIVNIFIFLPCFYNF